MTRNLRIGMGWDVHPFALGRPLIVGGVTIPHERGLLGHSDADVLCHALCDALLGAAALGDIGTHFPDSQPQYKDVSSLVLLKFVCRLIDQAGFGIVNVDMTVLAQKPKIAPYVTQMRRNLADVLGVEENAVSIKATTTEGLGFVGRVEGIAACAIALLYQTQGAAS
ncbi:2-C-methyl-D-erythritol 2,4-cyclodiphosphate synthase [Desulfosoma caldarium]|uniref:2-C-methyl-D-erythritol 2,4-cyclodiphosphate synthase n=1 Tax=Desulfosoma caldarium TaxID=610254 RepID=A0A3N1UQ80_9BACT|nr:2-C-methyl-D-erythritol 2,4-cyclodiphosphate synthase [Desulfosoma caldarium]ROQ90687.1 2-C-methyl-D-erythritol 2,4-cyclodiphosphate synthase [Desulfosoma caldarium]